MQMLVPRCRLRIEQQDMQWQHNKTIHLPNITIEDLSAFYLEQSVESCVVHLIVVVVAAISVEAIANSALQGMRYRMKTQL